VKLNNNARQGLEHHQGLKSHAELKRFGHRFFETELGDKAKVAEASNVAQVSEQRGGRHAGMWQSGVGEYY
jgi:hypothetical protein